MGFFSWRSVVSGKDIMNKYSGKHEGIGMLLPDGSVISGDYDGYGRIETSDGRGMDIHGIDQAVFEGKEPRDVSDEELDKTRGEGIKRWYSKDKTIKLMLKSEIPQHIASGKGYADYKPSENAEGQGHWQSSYGRGDLSNLKD